MKDVAYKSANAALWKGTELGYKRGNRAPRHVLEKDVQRALVIRGFMIALGAQISHNIWVRQHL